MKTFVYVDGFNLYYRALKGTKRYPSTGRKWLDLYKFVVAAMPSGTDIQRINYYTSRISKQRNSTAPAHQQAYISALIAHIPCLRVYYGKFLNSKVKMFLKKPLELEPQPTSPIQPVPRFARVHKTEEKGTDVNIGVHLVRDAFQGKFEQAVVISSDSDLAEGIRIVVSEVKLPVVVIRPSEKQTKTLENVASEVRFANRHIPNCQLPAIIQGSNGSQVHKPSDW